MAATLCIGLLLACQSSSKPEGPPQFRAWCWTRSNPLGPWTYNRAESEAEFKRHAQIFPHHYATIKVWHGPAETKDTDEKEK